MSPPGLVLIMSGPPGAGKSTLVKKLRAAHPSLVSCVPRHTTRGKRPGEVHGVDKFFVTKNEMDLLLINQC